MEIVKELTLNATKQAPANYSLVGAQNIKLDPTGQYITLERGFKVAVDGINGAIVGVINCPKEVVIFTNRNCIYRLKELENGYDLVEVNSSWENDGLTIKGTYYYDINGNLSVVIAQSNDVWDVPLKVINLDLCSETDDPTSYEISPAVPVCNCTLVTTTMGPAMPSGIYYMFIRYKLSENVYTNWQPIGIPYYAYKIENKTIFNNNYSGSYGEQLVLTSKNHLTNNINTLEDCNYNFIFKLDFKTEAKYNYKTYQIGYILQHDNGSFGRIWREFDINNTSFIFDASNPKETSIDELIRPTFNLYNVKALTSFENRLYVANYKETNYNVKDADLENIANNIKPWCRIKEANKLSNIVRRPKEYNTNSTYYNYSHSLTSKDVTNDTATNCTINTNQKTYEINIATLISNGLFGDISPNIAILDVATNKRYVAAHIYLSLTYGNTDIKLIYRSNGEVGAIWNINALVSERLKFTWGDTRYNVPVITIDRQTLTTDGAKSKASNNTDSLTLHNGIKYAFYIHFVKKDGTYTNGYRINGTATGVTPVPLSIDGETITPFDESYNYKGQYYGVRVTNNDNKLYTYKAVFTNIQIPSDYIGAFISYYESSITKVTNVICIKNTNSPSTEYSKFKALEIEIGLSGYSGTKLVPLYSIDDSIISSYNEIQITDSIIKIGNVYDADDESLDTYGRANGIFYKTGSAVSEKVVYALVTDTPIVEDDINSLIPFGPIITKDDLTNGIGIYGYDENKEIELDYNYPARIINELDFEYDAILNGTSHGVYISDSSNVAIYVDEGVPLASDLSDENSYAAIVGQYTTSSGNTPLTYLKSFKYNKISRYNLNALSFKKEPIEVTSAGNSKYSSSAIENRLGMAFSVGYSDKLYHKTVVFPADSVDLYELKKEFIIEQYKQYNVLDDTYLTTEFDTSIRRSFANSNESSINAWRLFDPNDYLVLPKNKGAITNLIGVGNSLLIHTTYTLFGIDRNTILKSSSSSISVTSPDIFDLVPQELFTGNHGYGGLKYGHEWCVNHGGYFFVDIDNNRIYNYDNGQLHDLSLDILSYITENPITNAWFTTDFKNNRVLVSLRHKNQEAISGDYFTTFSVLIDTKKYISTHSYPFDVSISTKNNCYFVDATLQISPTSNKIYTFDESNENNDTHGKYFPSIDEQSYVEIIFNQSYEVGKILNSINYILEEESSSFNITGSTEHSDNIVYSGDELILYNDKCNSGTLDISNDNDITNKLGNIHKPWYNKGVWTFNYFRNVVNRDDYTKEFPYYNPKTGDYISSNLYNEDTLSLMYGQYFIARFIFGENTKDNIKLENIIFNVNKD